MKTYTVKKGDTLYKIAKANNTTVQAIMSLNKNIKNASVIRVGQVIDLPSSGASAPAPNPTPAEKDYAAIGKKAEACLNAIENLPEFIILEALINGIEN